MAGLNIPGIDPVFKPQSTGLDRAMEFMGKSQSAAGSMGQNIKQPGKTIGGGLTSGLSGAAAGASIGSAMTSAALAGSSAGPIGMGIGATVGLLGYFLS